MVKPCDKFQHLVVGPDGQTVDDMWGVLPTLGDYEEWRGVADGLITRAEAELTRYFEEHGAIPEEVYLPVEAVRIKLGGMPTDLPTKPKPKPGGGSSSKGGGKGMGLGLVLLVGAWALFGGRDR